MARDLAAALITQVTAQALRPVLLSVMEFDDGDLCLWNGYQDLVVDGVTYTGAGHLLGISNISETGELRAAGIQYTLSGIPNELIALALQADYQNRRAYLYFTAMLDDGSVISPKYELFRGRMDVMQFEESAESGTIVLSAENILIDLERAKNRQYTPEDQAIDFPLDKGLDFVASLQSKEITWT